MLNFARIYVFICLYTPFFWLASSLTSKYDDVRYAPFVMQVLLIMFSLIPLYILFNQKRIFN
jgi:hypothetical protein